MKQVNREIVNSGIRKTTCIELQQNPSSASRRVFHITTIGIVVVATIAISFIVIRPTGAHPDRSLAEPQLGSRPFANPPEVRYRAGEKRLRMVMELYSDAGFTIPNDGTENLRRFHGWDPIAPTPRSKEIGPGPTLRARLGDRVEVSFLNKIDDHQFPYTFVSDSEPGKSDFGCDKAGDRRDPKTGLIMPYPGNDTFPNCFHGSSTANIHFHGTHTSPDGLGDNVLVQVVPDPKQPDWTPTFDHIYESRKIPQKWADLPLNYRIKQMQMIKQHDVEATEDAFKNKLGPPEPLWPADQHAIAAGRWPQYLMGAFPNFFEIPDYDECKSASTPCRAGQAPGTHWYHAHKHGSTSLHILNGLAGAFIIESTKECSSDTSVDCGYDQFIRRFYRWATYDTHENILVFQQFAPNQNLEKKTGNGPPPVLINGRLTPTITMRPGEVQLWRLVNATEGNDAGIIKPDLFQAKDFVFMQTAMDGVQLSPANYALQPFLKGLVPNAAPAPTPAVPGLILAAGNRADLLVQAPAKAGRTAFTSGGPSGQILFFVNVVGDPIAEPNGPFPTIWPDLPEFLKDLAKPKPTDLNTVRFQWEDGRAKTGKIGGFPPHFMINDKQFEQKGPLVDQCMPLDGLQDWVLENYTTIPHPFHIHINPFQVIQIDTPTAPGVYSSYAPKDNFIWQDVVAIPAGVYKKDDQNKPVQPVQVTPGRVRIRQTFLDFVGTYVLHCHILAHEDRGMMQLVRVVPMADYPRGCQDNIPEHH